MKRIGVMLLVVLMLATPAFADGFDSVTKRVESHYGVRRTHPHLIGFALFFVKPAIWGSGVGGLKVAVFEKEGRAFSPSMSELDRIVQESVGQNWRPFVRVDSRRSGEATVIYVNCSGKRMQMLVASVDQGDITVVQMKVSQKAFKRWKNDPEGEAERSGSALNM
ncbi:MAG: hypothetical protein JXA73_02500 [Acidobacteria bacterium]|nr:hypothetical protein [Acidobacteriota bacterium]